jgi:hypothetical protein
MDVEKYAEEDQQKSRENQEKGLDITEHTRRPSS